MWRKIRRIAREFVRSSEFQAFRKRRLTLIGFGIVLAFIVMAIFAGWIAPHDPYEQHIEDRLQGPSWKYPMGTDWTGRCVFSRIVHGSGAVLKTGFSVVLIWSVIGAPLGLVAGYYKKVDFIMLRAVNVVILFPIVALAVVFNAVSGLGLMLILGIIGWVGFAKLTRDRVLKLRRTAASKVLSRKNVKISRHILRTSIALMILAFPAAILLVSAFSYMGFGAMPPEPEWGTMLSESSRYLGDPMPAPLLTIFPGTMLMLLIFGFYLMGDWLREILDEDQTFYLPGVIAQ
ncbi:MAG: ABC transporter permease [bacterium]